MQLSTLALLLSATAHCALGGDPAPTPGYEIGPAQWDFEVAPGRIERLNGTIEEVILKARAINPDYKLPEPPAGPEPDPRRHARDVQKRGQVKNCLWSWDLADTERIKQGANYLRGLSGTAVMGPGPGRCFRVSCSYKSGITWCNDVSS